MSQSTRKCCLKIYPVASTSSNSLCYVNKTISITNCSTHIQGQVSRLITVQFLRCIDYFTTEQTCKPWISFITSLKREPKDTLYIRYLHTGLYTWYWSKQCFCILDPTARVSEDHTFIHTLWNIYVLINVGCV